jgi:hypothetical protein
MLQHRQADVHGDCRRSTHVTTATERTLHKRDYGLDCCGCLQSPRPSTTVCFELYRRFRHNETGHRRYVHVQLWPRSRDSFQGVDSIAGVHGEGCGEAQRIRHCHVRVFECLPRNKLSTRKSQRDGIGVCRWLGGPQKLETVQQAVEVDSARLQKAWVVRRRYVKVWLLRFVCTFYQRLEELQHEGNSLLDQRIYRTHDCKCRREQASVQLGVDHEVGKGQSSRRNCTLACVGPVSGPEEERHRRGGWVLGNPPGDTLCAQATGLVTGDCFVDDVGWKLARHW